MDNRNGQEQWAQMEPRLKELVDVQHSASEIAEILNAEYGAALTRNAVIGKRARMFGRRVVVVNLLRKKAPPRPIREPKPPRNAVHIMNLKQNQCRWMDGPAASLLYCGAATAQGVSWCPQHERIVYGKGNGRS